MHRLIHLISTVDLGESVSVSQRGGESKGSSMGVGNDGSGVVSGGSDHGGGVVSDGSSVHGLGGNGGGVDGVSGLGDDGVESVVGIGGVVDGAGGSVSLDQGVVSLDDISVAGLGLALLVAGVGISHSVLERVVRGGLSKLIFSFRFNDFKFQVANHVYCYHRMPHAHLILSAKKQYYAIDVKKIRLGYRPFYSMVDFERIPN
jgi:hypothetical protein